MYRLYICLFGLLSIHKLLVIYDPFYTVGPLLPDYLCSYALVVTCLTKDSMQSNSLIFCPTILCNVFRHINHVDETFKTFKLFLNK
ncbi:hypothetical protein HanXRQr2_Chr02g0064571 [Helianthus annuus]|uniref:Secreted protein n=1 Tax=Helianthus annuus TaxID=4232 RepID=A0A9K3JND8_HELAN|nr:hypothetical protein HanXRQr2_Chr02g0064571 [Helianthus annuus]KAJ0951710.1 hypothetical protein HanPSC8_Chr02g0063531 [Helianthus annuus]